MRYLAFLLAMAVGTYINFKFGGISVLSLIYYNTGIFVGLFFGTILKRNKEK